MITNRQCQYLLAASLALGVWLLATVPARAQHVNLGGRPKPPPPKSRVGQNVGDDLHISGIVGGSQHVKGRPILLTFWATTSTASTAVIPQLNAWCDKYQGKGLEVICVSNEDSGIIDAFFQKTRLLFPVASDPDLCRKYEIKFVPQALLVDKGGIVVWEGNPKNLTSDIIEKCLPGAPSSR